MDENQGNISCKRQFAATRLSGEPLALGAYGIQLSADEWTAYNFQSLSARSCDVALRVKARVVPCVLEVSVGEQTQSVSVTNTDWAEIALNAVAVPKGAGNLKYAVKQGTVEVDWAEFKVAGEAVAR